MQESWGSAVQGQTFAASRGWDVNVSIQPVTGSVITAFPEDRLIVGNTSTKGVTLQGLNLKKGQEEISLKKFKYSIIPLVMHRKNREGT